MFFSLKISPFFMSLKATNDFWWDGVHTTPKGSRAVADKIFPKLINFLN